MAWDDGGKTATRALLSDTGRRTTLIADIVNEIRARGIDGVSLDFEPILSDQRDNFAAFVNELRAALYVANPAYQLTFAATGSQPSLTYQMIGSVTASGAADAVIIMGYPLRAIDARYAGGLAPMYSATSYDLIQITNAYLGRASPDKVVMALPWYGRDWPTVTADVNSAVQTDDVFYYRAHNIDYSTAKELAATYGRQLDPVEQSAWTQYRWQYCAEAPETWKQVYYEDVETLGYKYDWVASKGLAGIGIWALGYDDAQPEFWKLLRVKYRGLIDTRAPTGTVALAADEHVCQPTQIRITLTSDDGTDGSGAVFVRLSNAPDVGGDGTLVKGRTYPTTTDIAWPLDDPSVGGSGSMGARNVYAQWRDVAGNWSPVSSTSLTLALPAAASVVVANGATVVRNANVPVRVTQTDGRAISRVLVSNTAMMQNGVLASSVDVPLGQAADFSLINAATGGSDIDGSHALYVQWQDTAGCWSSAVSASVTLDRTPPAGSLSVVGSPTVSTTGAVQVLVSATDTGGGATTSLSNDGTTWQDVATSSDPIDWSAAGTPDGTWTISARWTDSAGNVSQPVTTSLVLDRHGPTGSLTINGGTAATSSSTVTVSAPAIDSPSSVAAVVLSNSATMTGGVLTNGQTFAPGSPISWPLSGAGAPTSVVDGLHTVYVQWQDSVGNWSGVTSGTVVVDRTAPSVTMPTVQLHAGGRLETTTVPIDASWSAQDATTAVAQQLMQVVTAGTPSRPGITGLAAATPPATVAVSRTSSWVVRVVAVDTCGNTSAPVDSRADHRAGAGGLIEGDQVHRHLEEGKHLDSVRWHDPLRHCQRGNCLVDLHRPLCGLGRVHGPQDGQRQGVHRRRLDQDRGPASRHDLSARARFHRELGDASGAHTIKVKVLGTAGRPRVEMDAFVVLQ